MKVSECISYLVAYNGSLQIAHWLADTVTNEHKALGDLYESMTGLVDTFAETYMGKYGMVTFPDDCEISDITDAPCSEGLDLVKDLQDNFKAGEDDDLLNILADMSTALHKAKYLLKEKGSTKPEEEEADDTEEEAPSSPTEVVDAAKRTLAK